MLAAPALIFWLWLMIQPAGVAILCPEEWWCETGGYHVDCSESLLNSIPLILRTNTRRLALNDSRITSLEKDDFVSRGLTELGEFGAKFVRLATIELGAFNWLTVDFVISVCPSATTGGFFIKFDISILFENPSRKLNFH
jgi:hypothetical protein